jgi:hypothetical protein
MDAPPIINPPTRPPRNRSCFLALLVCLGFPFAVFCYLGFTRIPPSDEKLIASFDAHRAAYERLRQMLQADGQLRSVGTGAIRGGWIATTNSWAHVKPQEAHFPLERHHEYLTLLNEVGAAFVVRRPGEPADIQFFLWHWGFGSMGGSIGICWEHQAPTNQIQRLADHIRRAGGGSFMGYRHIEGNWYLWTTL